MADPVAYTFPNSTVPSILFDTTNASLLNATQHNEHPLCELRKEILSVYFWPLFAIGVPANVLCVMTVLTMQTMTPATFYVAVLAVCDGVAICAKLVGRLMLVHQVYLGDWGCKSRFVVLWLSTLANWVLVLICAERFVSVCFPLKKSIIYTKTRSYKSVMILALTLFAIYGGFFVALRKATPSGYHCGTDENDIVIWTHWYWLNVTLHVLLPFPCIVIFTTMIILGLRKSRRDRRAMMCMGNGSANGRNHDSNRRLIEETERLEYTITVMLIVAAIIFLALTLPSCIYYLKLALVGSLVPCYSRWAMFEAVQTVMIDSSHAVNFFLYFFSAQRFREQLCRIITCKATKLCKRRRGCYDDASATTKYTITRTQDDVTRV